MSSEENLQSQLQDSRIAREDRARVVERRIRGLQHVPLKGYEAGSWNRCNVVEESADILSMVQHISRGSTEFNFEPLRDGEAFQGGQIDVIDGLQLQCVAAHRGQSAVARLDILGIGIVCLIPHNSRRIIESIR